MAFAFLTDGIRKLAERLARWFGPREGLPSHVAVATLRIVPRPARRPLRVVHSGQGRMVISGRLADVCAELDRLAAQEAAQALAPAR